ncbi:MAG: hypothetical protein L7F78_22640, partial [Syntrophales bacterium LBB04]|nr:hypothetical protein [Syntrophales bacterium LBB04]
YWVISIVPQGRFLSSEFLIFLLTPRAAVFVSMTRRDIGLGKWVWADDYHEEYRTRWKSAGVNRKKGRRRLRVDDDGVLPLQ